MGGMRPQGSAEQLEERRRTRHSSSSGYPSAGSARPRTSATPVCSSLRTARIDSRLVGPRQARQFPRVPVSRFLLWEGPSERCTGPSRRTKALRRGRPHPGTFWGRKVPVGAAGRKRTPCRLDEGLPTSVCHATPCRRIPQCVVSSPGRRQAGRKGTNGLPSPCSAPTRVFMP